jgi:hypothetical protein
MRLIIFFIIAIVGFAVALLIRLPHSDSMERLVKPGFLTASHTKYEDDCAQCHDAFKKKSQNNLCLNCHKEVAADLKNNHGFHGASGYVKEKQCKSCHTDHKGREFNIVHVDKEAFSHDETGFSLSGAHSRANVTCEACHLQGKKYRAAPKDCLSCHANNDTHKGQLGTNCASCHKETFWKDTYFDHKKTKFPLEGRHQKLACNACHVNETYKNSPICRR